MTLETFFHEHPKAALAFSGGVDSACLLWAAQHYGCDIRAYYVHTPLHPDFGLEDARSVAAQVGVPLTVLRADVLENEQVRANPSNRCYYCKRALFTMLWQAARDDGFTLLLDGTNASDDADDRPGMRALAELEVRSPLRECGVTKAQVRQICREAGLTVWDKPAYACLATRIPSGTPLSHDLLHRVEQAEDALFSMGFSDLRVRVFGSGARLQLTEEQMPRVLALHSEITAALKPLFPAVLLDLEPRTASE